MTIGAGSLEDVLEAVEDLEGQPRELRAPMIDRRLVDCPQHAIGDVRRPGYLQEVAAGRV